MLFGAGPVNAGDRRDRRFLPYRSSRSAMIVARHPASTDTRVTVNRFGPTTASLRHRTGIRDELANFAARATEPRVTLPKMPIVVDVRVNRIAPKAAFVAGSQYRRALPPRPRTSSGLARSQASA